MADQLTVPGMGPEDLSGARGARGRDQRARQQARVGGQERRCGWCRTVLPPHTTAGRPRLYCGQSCRQSAYEHRSTTAELDLPPGTVLVTESEMDGLQDRLFQLRCSIEDVQTLLAEKPKKAELEKALADLVRSTGRLDRLWLSGRATARAEGPGRRG